MPTYRATLSVTKTGRALVRQTSGPMTERQAWAWLDRALADARRKGHRVAGYEVVPVVSAQVVSAQQGT